ncbi:MAG: NUDIX domain-containing protein [Myxococcota bacterium]
MTDRIRPTARVLLFDPDDRVLLLRTWPTGTPEPDWWYVPGGGVEAGETHEEAALRELYEETGCSDAVVGPCVWTRVRWVERYGQHFHDRFHIARVERAFEPAPDDPEWRTRDVSFRFRWWSMAELATTSDRFDPFQMRTLLPDLVRGVPDEPVPIEPLPMA